MSNLGKILGGIFLGICSFSATFFLSTVRDAHAFVFTGGDATNTINHAGSGASVTWEYWENHPTLGYAFVQITFNSWPRNGTGPVVLSDGDLDITLTQDASGAWLGVGTMTEPMAPNFCNAKQCSGTACNGPAPNIRCFQNIYGPDTCSQESCYPSGGPFTPLELDITF
jgi:hypothetical protein